nr:angiopoietin-related protein 4-like [Drosophila bipectinata]
MVEEGFIKPELQDSQHQLKHFERLFRYKVKFNKKSYKMIFPVALISTCFLISACLGSTTSKTESIDFPDPCPRDQKEFHVLREIQLPGSDPFEVNCISHSIFGSGWLSVFNKRHRAPMNTHTYEDFERGYGDIVTSFLNEFFIGLNRWHHLTNGKPHEVLLNTYPRPIRCDNFVVGDQREGYKVKNIGNCSGSDVWMIPKQDSKFSTFDRDEDGDPGRNLAKEVGYGWWFDPSMSPKSPDSSYSFYIYIRRTD